MRSGACSLVDRHSYVPVRSITVVIGPSAAQDCDLMITAADAHIGRTQVPGVSPGSSDPQTPAFHIAQP